jgi:hypothetical protein
MTIGADVGVADASATSVKRDALGRFVIHQIPVMLLT